MNYVEAATYRTPNMLKPNVFVIVLLAALAAGCTVFKPLVCTVSLPVQAILEAGEDEDEGKPEAQFETLPPVVEVPTAVILIPPAFAFLAATGAATGAVSGLVSDLNFILGHASFTDSMYSLPYPFRTNIRKQDDP